MGDTVPMSAPRPRPLVGVTTYRQTTAWWSWERDAALVPGPYLDVITAAGGQPLLIPPDRAAAPDPGTPAPDPGDRGGSGPRSDPDAVVAALDALVLIGGGDIDAARFGQAPDPRSGGTDAARDELELDLVRAALAVDLPVLAVCRGLQLLNVALGGDLIQHLPDRVGSHDHQPRPGAFGPITVTTTPGSTVHRVVGDRVEVLCSHHQAVDTLGRGLVVTATSADGVIEAVELTDRRFVVGVQWHPEETGDVALFGALLEAARHRSGSHPVAAAGATGGVRA